MPMKKMKFAELINGRAAMAGCSILAIGAVISKSDWASILKDIDVNALWWALGIYAG